MALRRRMLGRSPTPTPLGGVGLTKAAFLQQLSAGLLTLHGELLQLPNNPEVPSLYFHVKRKEVGEGRTLTQLTQNWQQL